MPWVVNECGRRGATGAGCDLFLRMACSTQVLIRVSAVPPSHAISVLLGGFARGACDVGWAKAPLSRAHHLSTSLPEVVCTQELCPPHGLASVISAASVPIATCCAAA